MGEQHCIQVSRSLPERLTVSLTANLQRAPQRSRVLFDKPAVLHFICVNLVFYTIHITTIII